VRLEVRERFYVGEQREADQWPLPHTEYVPLHLDARSGELAEHAAEEEGEVDYTAEGTEHAEFTHTFTTDSDLIGPMALRLWVQAEGSDDMDLFVAVHKLDEQAEVVPFSFFNALEDGPVALGWLRVSHRELDLERSTPGQPWHPHRREQPLAPGEIAAVDIEIWPSATHFAPGQQLRLIIQGSDTYTYPPQVVIAGHSQTRNAGRHIIHTGGRHDSHLLVPVVSS
jgi:hypothetical protein